MATSANEIKSIGDGPSISEKEKNNPVKSKGSSIISEDASSNDCVHNKKQSIQDNSLNFSLEDTSGSNILNDTGEGKIFKLITEENYLSEKNNDFQNGESKDQSVHDEHFVTNDKRQSDDDDDDKSNIESPMKDSEDTPSNADEELVFEVIDEDTESGKTAGCSDSNKEDSSSSIYEEDSQQEDIEESDTIVLSDEGDPDIIVESSIICFKETPGELSNISIHEDENNSGSEINSASNDSFCVIVSEDETAEDDPIDISNQLQKGIKRDVPNSSDDESKKSETSTKRQKELCNHEFTPSINNAYLENNFIKELSTAFQEKKTNIFEHSAQIINEPFTCCVLPNFIQPDDYVHCLKQELMNLEMTEKLNDLYQFKSKNLEDSMTQNIAAFKCLITEQCLNWMTKITNIPLDAKVDISCASYTKTDHLLCHDDELEGRRIAFIFYLVPPDWDENDGGTLDLFASVDGEPSEIHTSFSPKFNNFIFFEVGPVSFHQVSEVLTSKNRLSISGWFYGPPLTPSIPKKESLLFSFPNEIELDIREWVNPAYLTTSIQGDVRHIFEESCEISLPTFLKEAKYKEVCEALRDPSINWTQKGPVNMRKFHEAVDEDKIPKVLLDCKNLFSSKPFYIILSNLTAVNLYPLNNDPNKFGKVYSCVRKWSHGSYTLLHDQSFAEEYSLNVIMYFNCSDWSSEYGGYTSYVAVEEKEQLLHIDPKPNMLGIAYITQGTSNFVKYVNSQANKLSPPFFNDIYSMYMQTV